MNIHNLKFKPSLWSFIMEKVFTPETGTVHGACTLQGGYAR